MIVMNKVMENFGKDVFSTYRLGKCDLILAPKKRYTAIIIRKNSIAIPNIFKFKSVVVRSLFPYTIIKIIIPIFTTNDLS